MLNILLNWILPFVFILGAAVVLHEFGHFNVAKILRVRVETFSVGFGPRLFGKVWGTTDYRVSLIPLGGYVKLGGDDSNAPVEGASAQNIPARERFDLRPRWQKFLVMVAGPVMNILTALAVVSGRRQDRAEQRFAGGGLARRRPHRLLQRQGQPDLGAHQRRHTHLARTAA